MIKVYVAGPYSADNVIDVLKNIGRGEKMCSQLFQDGFAPFCPWHDKSYVIDEHDGMPLTFATVEVVEADKSTIGDSTGYYEIKGLCRGEYTVICRHIGCEPEIEKLKIRKDVVFNFCV